MDFRPPKPSSITLLRGRGQGRGSPPRHFLTGPHVFPGPVEALSGSPILLKIVSENRFSGKTYFMKLVPGAVANSTSFHADSSACSRAAILSCARCRSCEFINIKSNREINGEQNKSSTCCRALLFPPSKMRPLFPSSPGGGGGGGALFCGTTLMVKRPGRAVACL